MSKNKILFEIMQQRILDIANPDKDYTQEDFDKEFADDLLKTNTTISDSNLGKLTLEFVNNSSNPDPEYATDGSSAFDLRSNANVVLSVGERALIPTGLFFNIPDNYEIQVRPRSGLAINNGVTVLNAPGTVDSDYIGEVKVPLINHGRDFFEIKVGDRIAQAVVSFVTAKKLVNLKKVSEINKHTERGAGGFGHTGLS